MSRIDVFFLLLGSLCLVSGVSLGFYMGIIHDFQLTPVHAHLNLVGWASLALFGLVYRSFPELRRSRLAVIHFWLSAPSGVAFPVFLWFAVAQQISAPAIVAALGWLAGSVIFFVACLRLAWTKERKETVLGHAPAE